MVSLCQVECGVATALLQRILHGSDLLGVVQSASLFEVRVDVLIRSGKVVSWRCIVRLASMSQSDQPKCFELSLFRRALMSQSNPLVLFFVFFLFISVAWLCPPRDITLYFSTISNKNALIKLKKRNIYSLAGGQAARAHK